MCFLSYPLLHAVQAECPIWLGTEQCKAVCRGKTVAACAGALLASGRLARHEVSMRTHRPLRTLSTNPISL